MPSKLEHALQLASDGFYVFPCEVNGKLPTIPWRDLSTRRAETIKDWFVCPVMGWEQDYNIGIDCGKSGILVVDVDCKNGQPGKENYEKLNKEKGFGENLYTVTTPSGGLHIYYRNSDFKSTTSSLAAGIDTRGVGGFVLAAGSEINGNAYHESAGALRSRDTLEHVPSWLGEALHSSKKKPSEGTDKAHSALTEDEPGDITYAIELLQNLEGSVEDGTGDISTYKTFCKLKECGVSLETAIELALEHWNPKCCPPWDDDELRRKAENAYNYAQNATGSKSPHAEFEIPKDFRKEITTTSAIPAGYNQGFLLPDAASFPKRDWVFGKIALAKNVTLIIAPPGVGKSTLTLAIALSKASGKNILGVDPLERGAVAIFNNEDTTEEQSRRLVAAAQYYKITNDDICFSDAIDQTPFLYLNGRDNAPLKIAKRMTDGTIRADQAAGLVEYLLKHKIRMLIVDPLAMTHPASENSNEEMLVVGNLYAEVANRANCAVILVHHTRKLSTADSEGHSGNLDSARGASSLGGLARVAYTLNVISKQDAKLYAIEPKDKNKFLLFEQAKANMSAPGEHRLFFERYGEIIGANPDNIDGESVGVLKPAHFIEHKADNGNALLIREIENYAEHKEVTIASIVTSLVNDHVMYMDKQPSTVSKAIYRLFGEDNSLHAFKGMLFLEQPMQGKKKLPKIIRWESFGDTDLI